MIKYIGGIFLMFIYIFINSKTYKYSYTINKLSQHLNIFYFQCNQELHVFIMCTI